MAYMKLLLDANATIKVGYDISLKAGNQIKKELPVLNVITHIDPV
jgi:divalent metal cation (Fe/Co/Zn/Cd) transporter